MRDRTVKLILAQSLARLALQEVTGLASVSTARETVALGQLQAEMHRSFITLSQLMDKELNREAEDAR